MRSAPAPLSHLSRRSTASPCSLSSSAVWVNRPAAAVEQCRRGGGCSVAWGDHASVSVGRVRGASTSICGSACSSQGGSHPLARPRGCISVGTKTMRTIVASATMAAFDAARAVLSPPDVECAAEGSPCGTRITGRAGPPLRQLPLTGPRHPPLRVTTTPAGARVRPSPRPTRRSRGLARPPAGDLRRVLGPARATPRQGSAAGGPVRRASGRRACDRHC